LPIDNIVELIIDDDEDHQPAQMKVTPSASTNTMDGPLLIVPDDDDYGDVSEEEESISLLKLDDASESMQMVNAMAADSKNNENCHFHFTEVNLVMQAINEMGELLAASPVPTPVTRCSSKQRVNSRKTNATQRSIQVKLPRRPPPPSLTLVDSILSTISFDDKSDILTISRMGSIYYCLEDLYLKAFSPLCTLEELTDLLVRSETVLLKHVTLSEKIAIEERIPRLKSSCLMRYRLISLNFSDYLHKLKTLLQQHSAASRLDRILKKMRRDKPSATNIPCKQSSSRCQTIEPLVFSKRQKNCSFVAVSRCETGIGRRR
jgi:hypothetical protein